MSLRPGTFQPGAGHHGGDGVGGGRRVRDLGGLEERVPAYKIKKQEIENIQFKNRLWQFFISANI